MWSRFLMIILKRWGCSGSAFDFGCWTSATWAILLHCVNGHILFYIRIVLNFSNANFWSGGGEGVTFCWWSTLRAQNKWMSNVELYTGHCVLRCHSLSSRFHLLHFNSLKLKYRCRHCAQGRKENPFYQGDIRLQRGYILFSLFSNLCGTTSTCGGSALRGAGLTRHSICTVTAW